MNDKTELRGQCNGLAFITADDRCPNETRSDWSFYRKTDGNHELYSGSGYYDANDGLTVRCIS